MLLTVLLAFVGLGCRPAPRREFTRICMGVQTRVIVYAEAERAEAAAKAAFERIAALEAALSDYRVENEIARLRTAPVSVPIQISSDLASALEASGELHRASGGLFDPTVGPLTLLWREARRTGRKPTSEALASARAAVGFGKLSLDGRGGTVTFHAPGVSLDFGGLGKGLAAQEAVETLRGLGVSRCLVALGGDVHAGEPPPGADGWRIGLFSDSEVADSASSAARPPEITLRNAGVSTSGDAAQIARVGGEAFSHIVMPTGPGLRAATGHAIAVIGRRGAVVDGLGTALALTEDPVEAARGMLAAFPGTAGVVRVVEGGKPGATEGTVRYTVVDPSGIFGAGIFRAGSLRFTNASTPEQPHQPSRRSQP